MNDAELVAIITGCFLVLAAGITGVFAALTARINRGGKRYEALEAVVSDQAQEIVRMKVHGHAQDRALKALEETNSRQQKEMATLHERVAVFQVYVDAVDEVFSTTPDDATMGSIRPKLPLKPDTTKTSAVPAPQAGVETRAGKRHGVKAQD